MTHIKNRVFRVIDLSDINKKWCRSMNEKIELELGWNNEPLKENLSHPGPSIKIYQVGGYVTECFAYDS